MNTAGRTAWHRRAGAWVWPYLRVRPARLRRRVAGRRVLVTGASHGIGAACAMQLAAAGAVVLLSARSADLLRQLALRIRARGGRADVFPADLSDPAQVDALALALVAAGGVEILVHNAGKSIRRTLLASLERPQDIERTLAVNYRGPAQLQRELIRLQAPGRLRQTVNVSSAALRLPPAPRWSAYLASKAALDIWLRSTGGEWHDHGIRHTSLYVPLVHTRMSAPTASLQRVPGLSAEQAARRVCTAIARAPRRMAPWWLWPTELLCALLPTPSAWLLEQLFAHGRESPASGTMPP